MWIIFTDCKRSNDYYKRSCSPTNQTKKGLDIYPTLLSGLDLQPSPWKKSSQPDKECVTPNHSVESADCTKLCGSDTSEVEYKATLVTLDIICKHDLINRHDNAASLIIQNCAKLPKFMYFFNAFFAVKPIKRVA